MSSLYSNSTLKPNSATQQLEPSISVESKARKESAWLLSYIGIFIALLAFFILIISLLKLETSVPKRSHQTLVFNLEKVLLSQKQQYGLDWLNIDATPTKGVRISLAQDLVAGEPMFASAQAQINPAYLPNLRKLLAMLQAVNVNVMEQRYSKLIGKIESSGYKLKLVWRIGDGAF